MHKLHARSNLFLFFIILSANSISLAQTADSVNVVETTNVGGRDQFILSHGQLAIVTSTLKWSLIEERILVLEDEERSALLKRDTAALMRIWARDYSLDEPVTGLVNGRSTLPYYTLMSRLVERLSVYDTVAFTSGFEHVQVLNADGRLSNVTRRTFFHTWRSNYGVWKLTTKIHE